MSAVCALWGKGEEAAGSANICDWVLPRPSLAWHFYPLSRLFLGQLSPPHYSWVPEKRDASALKKGKLLVNFKWSLGGNFFREDAACNIKNPMSTVVKAADHLPRCVNQPTLCGGIITVEQEAKMDPFALHRSSSAQDNLWDRAQNEILRGGRGDEIPGWANVWENAILTSMSKMVSKFAWWVILANFPSFLLFFSISKAL